MIQFTGNWYIDMGIVGMLNMLYREFPYNILKKLNKKL
jgi:hypothetical protein